MYKCHHQLNPAFVSDMGSFPELAYSLGSALASNFVMFQQGPSDPHVQGIAPVAFVSEVFRYNSLNLVLILHHPQQRCHVTSL